MTIHQCLNAHYSTNRETTGGVFLDKASPLSVTAALRAGQGIIYHLNGRLRGVWW